MLRRPALLVALLGLAVAWAPPVASAQTTDCGDMPPPPRSPYRFEDARVAVVSSAARAIEVVPRSSDPSACVVVWFQRNASDSRLSEIRVALRVICSVGTIEPGRVCRRILSLDCKANPVGGRNLCRTKGRRVSLAFTLERRR